MMITALTFAKRIVVLALVVGGWIVLVPMVFAYALLSIWLHWLVGLPTNPTEARLAKQRDVSCSEESRRRLKLVRQPEPRPMRKVDRV
jgi:hypothetical protein